MESKSNRCAIVVIWNEAGLLPAYMRFYIGKLLEVCSRVIVVFNGNCLKSTQTEVLKLGAECLSRDNVGYDFAAYQCGLKHIGYEKLASYDQIVLCNSSCYGPVFPLEKIFNSMSLEKDVDFWGITQWIGPSWPTHIQSYFYVFNKSILKSNQFRNYWENLLPVKTRFEAIVCLESRLTRYFESRGFRWRCYLPKERYYPNSSDCTMDEDYFFELLKKGMPFIKRKLVFQISKQEKISDLYSFLRLQSYPSEVIIEDLKTTELSTNYQPSKSKNKLNKRWSFAIVKRRFSHEIIYLKVKLRLFLSKIF